MNRPVLAVQSRPSHPVILGQGFAFKAVKNRNDSITPRNFPISFGEHRVPLFRYT